METFFLFLYLSERYYDLMNKRIVTFVLLLLVWLGVNMASAQHLPKLYQVFSPDKKLMMGIERHNDGLLTYTFAADRDVLIKESPLGFKLESQETVPSSDWKIEKVSDRQVRDEWRPLWGKRAVVEDHFNELVIDLLNPAGQPQRMQLVVGGIMTALLSVIKYRREKENV